MGGPFDEAGLGEREGLLGKTARRFKGFLGLHREGMLRGAGRPPLEGAAVVFQTVGDWVGVLVEITRIFAGRYPVHQSDKTEQAGHGKEHERWRREDALFARARL